MKKKEKQNTNDFVKYIYILLKSLFASHDDLSAWVDFFLTDYTMHVFTKYLMVRPAPPTVRARVCNEMCPTQFMRTNHQMFK